MVGCRRRRMGLASTVVDMIAIVAIVAATRTIGGALAVLALRGALYPLSDNPYWLVSVQLLDGVGAGIFGALFPLVVADLTRGTGHFNVSQGAIATAAGLGGALSAAVAGFIVVGAGYSAAFLFLAGIAAAGLIGFCTMMPETLRDNAERPAATTVPAPSIVS